MAKLEQRRRVRHRFTPQIKAEKTPKRLAVINGVFQRLVGQPKPLLEKIQAQHPLQADRRPARTLARRGIVMRTQRLQQPGPRHHELHLRQETVPARGLALGVIFGLGEGDLLGHGAHRNRREDGRIISRAIRKVGINQCLLKRLFKSDLLLTVSRPKRLSLISSQTCSSGLSWGL